MPEPLDNAWNSFPLKLKILDKTPSSQNMRGQTVHNRPSSSNSLAWRKRRHPIFEDKHPGCMFQLSLQVSGIPWPIFCRDLDLCCSTWMGLNGYFHHLCLSLYLWTLSAKKSCGSVAWLEIRSLAELFIESCILVHIYSVISPSWCMDCSLALSTQGYDNLFVTVSDFTMPNHSLLRASTLL